MVNKLIKANNNVLGDLERYETKSPVIINHMLLL